MNRKQASLPRSGRGQNGFGLVEVLVTVVVLAIGLLGLASLQMHSLRNNESSLERGMAVVETHSVIEAMHADRTNAMNGAFNVGDDDEDSSDEDPSNETSFAKATLAAWREHLVAVLGEGATGGVVCDGTDCMVTVSWNDSRASGGAEKFSLQTRVQL